VDTAQKDNRPIGIFDSGIGGLSVLESCRAILPYENFIYLADNGFAPYGDKCDDYIRERVFCLSECLIARGVKAIVVACNTATNVGIKMLRERYKIPFVGLEPAIKPARVVDGKTVLLCTPATARQEKFLQLVERYGTEHLIIAPQPNLATIIENCYPNIDLARCEIYKTLNPYADAKAIILGCTHYVLVKDIILDFYNHKNPIFDGNEGASKRLKELLSSYNATNGCIV